VAGTAESEEIVMSENEGPTPQLEVPKLPSLPLRIVQVFVAPVRLFEALRGHPVAWSAILIAAVLASAANGLIPAGLWEDMMREQMTQAGADLPDDLGTVVTIARFASVAGSFFFYPVIVAIMAGLFSLLFLFGMGFEGRFKQYFSIAAHASLVLAVIGVILTPLRILSGNVQFSVNVGALLPFLEGSLLGRWSSMMDVFSLWSVALIGVGAAVIDGKKSPATAAGVAVGALLLVMLIFASFGLGGAPG
jgi:hypothetical protein